MDTPSLLDLFHQNQKEPLLFALHDIITDFLPVPLDELLYILDNTMDIDIIGPTLEVLYFFHEDLHDPLTKAYYDTESEVLQFYILLVLSISPSITTMRFLIHEYLSEESLRPFIRDHAFNDKMLLLSGLAYYTESESLSDQDEITVQDLLCTIPRSVFTLSGGVFNTFKLYSLYYATDPKKRSK